MRAIICPLRTRVPRSTACSTRRPGPLTPSTTVSSAANAPVDATVRGTRSSTAGKTLTGRGGTTAAGFSVDAEAEADAVDWPVQPAAASTTASSANQGRGIRQMIPQNACGPVMGVRRAAGAPAEPWHPSIHPDIPAAFLIDHRDGARGRAAGPLEARRGGHDPEARGADPAEVGQVLDQGAAGGEDHVVRRAFLGRQLDAGLEDRGAQGVVGGIVVADGLPAAAHEP